MTWNLDDTFVSSAGRVAAGRFGEGPDLFLAPGWPWSSFSWHLVIPTLAKHYRIHWYDMPGYGQSEMHPEKQSSLDIQGQVFAEMIEHGVIAAAALPGVPEVR